MGLRLGERVWRARFELFVAGLEDWLSGCWDWEAVRPGVPCRVGNWQGNGIPFRRVSEIDVTNRRRSKRLRTFRHRFKALQFLLQLPNLSVSLAYCTLQVLYSACCFLATSYRSGFRRVLHFQHKTSHILHKVLLRLEGFLGSSLPISPPWLHSCMSLTSQVIHRKAVL